MNTGRGNAVTPIPSWPMSEGYEASPVSDDPPNDLLLYGALDFSVWKSIGEEFMIKSTVNNWIACVNNTGSLTRYVRGSLSCRLIHSITSVCPDLPTTSFQFDTFSCGPPVKGQDRFYYFEGCINNYYWPVHDPCGEDKLNNLENRWPQGQIWVR